MSKSSELILLKASINFAVKSRPPNYEILHKMVVRIANREYPDQTASSEAVWSGSVLMNCRQK